MGEEEENKKKPQITALIIALTSLITAVGAIIHRPTEDAAKAGYIELTKAILESQEAERKNHDDLMAMRTYLDGYTHSHEAVMTTVSTEVADAGKKEITHSPAPAPHTVSVVKVAPVPSAAPPPTIAPLMQSRVKTADAIRW